MRNEGLGSWPARRARKTPHRTALVHSGSSTDDSGSSTGNGGLATGHSCSSTDGCGSSPDPSGSSTGHNGSSTDHCTPPPAPLAHARRARGVRGGDRVASLAPTPPSYWETLSAAGTLGAVFAPLNPRLTAPEIAYQLADSGAKVLVHGPTHAGLVA